MWQRSEVAKRYCESLGLLSFLCLAFLGYRAIATGSTRYWFIPENLLLAWAGLIFGWLLVGSLRVRRWLSWQNLALTLLWIFFLPNTWYVITDFIHVFPTGEISELYDFVMISILTFTGFILGFTSLYLVHRELQKRLSSAQTWALIYFVILLSSFAIYLGRVLRWSSWDFVTNTTGLIVNVTDRVTDPLGNPHALNMTGLFFVCLGVCYLAFWRGLSLIRPSKTGR